MAKKRPFSDIFKRYEKAEWTYDPKVEGYGNVADWRSAWESMGMGEATKRVKGKTGNSLLALLGLDEMPGTKAELTKHYHRLMLKNQDAFLPTASIERQEEVKKMIAD